MSALDNFVPYRHTDRMTPSAHVGDNKHFEILVSFSDKKRNCKQAHETACKLMKLNVSSWKFM